MKDPLPHTAARVNGWLPSLSAMIWIALFLGLNLTSARIVLISADSDSALHRRLGDWIIQHGVIIHEDTLLHTYHGSSMAKEWLSEVVFAAAGRLFGWNGFVLLAATLIATCFWLLYHQLVSEGSDALLATILVLAAMLACSMHWLARPLLFTHLLALVFAWQLRAFQQGRVSARKLFLLLPPLMVLWTNLHGGFVVGLVLVAMYAGGSVLDARRQPVQPEKPKIFALLLLVCGLASLLNPSGWKLHAHILGFMRSRELSTATTEFASPNFHTVGMHGFLLLLFLVGAALLLVRPKFSATNILLVGGWGYFALLSARNVPIFALVVIPLIAQWIIELLQTHDRSGWCQLYRRWASKVIPRNDTSSTATVIAAIVCVVLIMARPTLADGAVALATDFPADRYPTVAVEYLQAHPDVVHGEMFNDFLWGGYLEFAFPERKPFIDSRNVLYGIDLLRDFRIVNEPRPGWQGIFTKYHIGWTILPAQHPLNRILELSPHWSLVFSNQETLVFSHAS